MGRSAERAAANEARFREANERIRARAVDLGALDQPSPYLCECDDGRCTAVVLLRAEEYEEVRSAPRRFVVVRGHQRPENRVFGEHGMYVVIEKTGEEGRLVEKSDPRT